LDPAQTPHNITAILQSWDRDPQGAIGQLTPLLYAELRKLAASYLRRERPDHTLQPTALIHEAYLRLMDQPTPQWRDRAHFFGVAARIMRQLLVDFARQYRAAKRDAGHRVTLEPGALASLQRSEELLAVDEALEKLRVFDERKCQVIELRYFGGLTREEVAEALGLTLATVKRDLTLGEAWLRRALDNTAPAPAGF
jgi:RNA polymerase sigma factor (TIGR02999 family)